MLLRFFAVILGMLWAAAFAAEPWSVSRVEALALERDARLKAMAQQIASLSDQAAFDETLPDPQVVLAARNLPTESLSFTQEPMTQMVIGIQQPIPGGDKLTLRSKLRLAEQAKLQAEMALQRRQLQWHIRQLWVELLYWRHLAQLLAKQDQVYAKLESVVLSRFRVGQRAQQDVFRIKTMRERIEERREQAWQQSEAILTQLARWVPELTTEPAVCETWPNWQIAADVVLLRSRLLHHPMLEASRAGVLQAKQQLALAEAAYTPDWRIGISYGIRSGETALGVPRSDFVSVDFAFSLPWQPARRQDKQVAARQKQLLSAEFRRDDVLASLKARLDTLVSRTRWLEQRIRHFDTRLLVVSERHRKAALDAYQRNTADFNDPMLAYDHHLQLMIQRLGLQKMLLANYAEIRFLTEESQ